MVIKIGMVKVWIGKGMIFKLIPPLKGLISLVTGYTTYEVTGALLLVLISINIKLMGSYLKSKKMVW